MWPNGLILVIIISLRYREEKMTLGWVVDGERRHAGRQGELMKMTLGWVVDGERRHARRPGSSPPRGNGTFGIIQGTFGIIQGTFGIIQGTFGITGRSKKA